MNFYKAILASLIFFNSPSHAADRSEISLGKNQDGSDLGMGLYQPAVDSNGAAIVFIVSGGMHSGLDVQTSYQPKFLPLVDQGFTVFTVRHTSIRNTGDPQSLIPTIFRQTSLAYEHIVQYASEYSIDPQRIGILGLSSGGVLAYFLALSEKYSDGADIKTRPKAVAVYAGPSELRGNFPSLTPINLVSENDPPVLLLHGNADEVVPFANSVDMNAALQAHGVPTEFVVIDGEGHDAVRSGSDGETIFNAAVLRWFTNYLAEQ